MCFFLYFLVRVFFVCLFFFVFLFFFLRFPLSLSYSTSLFYGFHYNSTFKIANQSKCCNTDLFCLKVGQIFHWLPLHFQIQAENHLSDFQNSPVMQCYFEAFVFSESLLCFHCSNFCSDPFLLLVFSVVLDSFSPFETHVSSTSHTCWRHSVF